MPPHAPGVPVNVEGSDVPLIKQPPATPFVKGIVLEAGNAPHDTVRSAGAVIVGNGAGSTVIVLDTDASGLPHGSVAVHVSVTVPPHPGTPPIEDGFEVPLIKQLPAKPFV